MSSSDSESSDGACWGEVLDLLDVCAPSTDPAADDGALFREALAAADIALVAEAEELQLAELLHEEAMGWLGPTLTEYELGGLPQLRRLFESDTAATTLAQLGYVTVRVQ